MSERIGKLLSCDRCGKTIFLKGEGTNELDGGYFKVLRFEKPPEGWGSFRDVYTLCPRCHEECDKLIEDSKEAANVKA